MGASHPARWEGLPTICGKTQVSKATGPKRHAQDCPPRQSGCVWFCLVGRVTPCAPSFRSRFTTRPPPPWLRRDEREDVATAFRLPPTISARLCLITRIDRIPCWTVVSVCVSCRCAYVGARQSGHTDIFLTIRPRFFQTRHR
jgi:hypothetical protein